MSAHLTTLRRPSQSRSHGLVPHALSVLGYDLQASGGVGFNPLVIVGPAGSGKSLVLADWFLQTTNQRLSGGSQLSAIMWDGLSLGREITAALSRTTVDRLHAKFVSTRLIVIDGVEQVAAWDAQRVLSHLFDTATAGGTVFVVTLRTHPNACPGLEPSLASRLSGGLVAELSPAPTPKGLRHPGDAEGRQNPTIRRVINAVARRHDLTAADIIGPSRCRQISHARGLAMYLARTLTAESLQTIGTACGGRDHTTVMHGIRVTQHRLASDPGLAADVVHVTTRLRS